MSDGETMINIKYKVLQMNPLGTRKKHLGLGFFRVPRGFICDTLYLILIIVSHSLTLVVGWLHRSHKYRQLYFNDVSIWLRDAVISYAVSRYLTPWPRDAARFKYPHFTRTYYRVSSTSVVRVSMLNPWRVVGSNPLWGLDFSAFPMGSFVTPCTSTICFFIILGN